MSVISLDRSGDARHDQFMKILLIEDDARLGPLIARLLTAERHTVQLSATGADGITFVKQAEDFGLMKDVTVGFLGFAETYLGAFGEGKGQNMWVTVPFAASLR